MVYEGDSSYSLYLPFYSPIPVVSHTIYPTEHDAPEEVFGLLLHLPVKSYHAAFTVLFLILSIISTAFAVCIPKKIHRISVFLFLAFILESE